MLKKLAYAGIDHAPFDAANLARVPNLLSRQGLPAKDRREPAVVQPARCFGCAGITRFRWREAMVYFASVQAVATNSLDETSLSKWTRNGSSGSAGQSLTGRDVITVPLPDSAMHAYNDGGVGANFSSVRQGKILLLPTWWFT
ncbi:MAG: hypothetical protein IPM36_08390 [Lewinellaceae bacterium]|nr:hypothetical protein [Lewinellaceae bacterium]